MAKCSHIHRLPLSLLKGWGGEATLFLDQQVTAARPQPGPQGSMAAGQRPLGPAGQKPWLSQGKLSQGKDALVHAPQRDFHGDYN